MKFAPFKPCTLPKHVRVEILHRELPVKNLYFPCKGLQCNITFFKIINPKFKCCPVIGQIQIWIDFLIAILCVKWAVG